MDTINEADTIKEINIETNIVLPSPAEKSKPSKKGKYILLALLLVVIVIIILVIVNKNNATISNTVDNTSSINTISINTSSNNAQPTQPTQPTPVVSSTGDSLTDIKKRLSIIPTIKGRKQDGSRFDFNCDNDVNDYLKTIMGTGSSLLNGVKGITFKCNSGKQSDYYGMNDNTHSFAINLLGTPLDTITGRAGWLLDSIEDYGGTGGDAFLYKCDNNYKIRGVTGTSTDGTVVNSIGFKCA